MLLTLAVATCTPDLFNSCVWHACQYAEGPLSVVAVGNGVALEPSTYTNGAAPLGLRSLPENVGAPAAFHLLWEMAREQHPEVSPERHLICYVHDDLKVLESGWNKRVERLFGSHHRAMLAGFAGTTGLGHGDIYKEPYDLTQLSRQGPLLSNLLLHAEFHGRRVTKEQQVAFVDGYAMVLRRSFLDERYGWSWWPPECIHHSYDYGIACMVKRHGGETWLVPVHHDHGVPDKITHGRHAGTAGNPIYLELAKKYGGVAEVHARGHRFVYDEFRDVLPIRV